MHTSDGSFQVGAMRRRELYGQYHRKIGELARSAGPETDWRPELKALIVELAADADALDPRSAQMLREDLSTQLEHEALHSTRLLARQILLAAVKWLELSS